MNILIVEDDNLQAEALKMIISTMPHTPAMMEA